MPELPEIIVLCEQMNKELIGNEIEGVKVLQPKNLNIRIEEFMDKIVGYKIISINVRGK